LSLIERRSGSESQLGFSTRVSAIVGRMGMKPRVSGCFDSWRDELLICGHIVQDADPLAGSPEATRLFERYLELLRNAKKRGDPDAVFQALIDSIMVRHDYGAYEATHNVIWSFSPEELGPLFARALPGLIERMGSDDQVGRFLCPLAGWARDAYLKPFCRGLGALSSAQRETVMTWVAEQETSGWFEKEPGLIRPMQ
jgi:hypothetical protein